jgi:Icc-related predicted phosphoesterase
MLIYAVADIHAKTEHLELIRSTVEFHRPDVLVVAGDIFNYLHPVPVLEALNDLGVCVLAVRGNSDPAYVSPYFNAYSNIRLLHASRVAFFGISFAGLSGTIPVPFRSRVGFREKHLIEKIRPLMDQSTVLIAHPPPYGTLDRVGKRFHAGSTLIRDLVVQTRPQVLICGHIHEDRGVAMIGATMIVNCCLPHGGRGALIELKDGSRPNVRVI